MDLNSLPNGNLYNNNNNKIPRKRICVPGMQHCYIQIPEWLQWRIQISGLESNKSVNESVKQTKYKESIKYYVPGTFLNQGHIRRE